MPVVLIVIGLAYWFYVFTGVKNGFIQLLMGLIGVMLPFGLESLVIFGIFTLITAGFSKFAH